MSAFFVAENQDPKSPEHIATGRFSITVKYTG
jgi:hypothetical protein